jgi:hypothetical protein
MDVLAECNSVVLWCTAGRLHHTAEEYYMGRGIEEEHRLDVLVKDTDLVAGMLHGEDMVVGIAEK